MPRLFDLIESYLRGESVRKAAVFTPEELMQFWKEASSKNTFWLVRKIASSLAFLGGNRLAELRRAKQSAISRCAEGYLFTFVPAKQRGHVRESSFLIPRGSAPNGVCFASMMDSYLESI